MGKMIKTYFRFFKKMVAIRPQILFLFFISVVHSLITTLVGIYGTSLIVKAAEESDGTKAIVTGIVVASVLFIASFLSKSENRLSAVEGEEINNSFTILLGQKFERLPYEILEDPVYLDKKESGIFALNNQGIVFQIISFTEEILGNMATLIASLVIIMMFDNWLLLVVAAGVVLFAIGMLIFSSSIVRIEKGLIPINRKFSYYCDLAQASSYGKDFRLYPLGDTVVRKTIGFNEETKPFLYRIFFTQQIGEKGVMQIISYLVGGASMILVGIKILREKMSLSYYSLYCGATLSLIGVVQSLSMSFTFLYSDIINLEPLIDFLYMDDDKEGGKEWDEKVKTIEFENVYFTYPRQKEEVLHDVSFVINAGEKISLIGLNGAGKTTLIKLLVGLYRPNKGRILINGHNIENYTFKSRATLFSTVFQDFKLFPLSIKENVMGKREDEAMYQKVMDESGSTEVVNKLKHGDESIIGKNFSDNGVDLSGGESQKIAIARAVMKESSIVVLDEPTSALDPIAESEIYENFNNMVKGKTAIFISHRMSSCIFSDKVLVIDHGKVVSFAPHAKLLLDKESLYYKMFMAQAKNYQLKKC